MSEWSERMAVQGKTRMPGHVSGCRQDSKAKKLRMAPKPEVEPSDPQDPKNEKDPSANKDGGKATLRTCPGASRMRLSKLLAVRSYFEVWRS